MEALAQDGAPKEQQSDITGSDLGASKEQRERERERVMGATVEIVTLFILFFVELIAASGKNRVILVGPSLGQFKFRRNSSKRLVNPAPRRCAMCYGGTPI